jgi:hypothetical protein
LLPFPFGEGAGGWGLFIPFGEEFHLKAPHHRGGVWGGVSPDGYVGVSPDGYGVVSLFQSCSESIKKINYLFYCYFFVYLIKNYYFDIL